MYYSERPDFEITEPITIDKEHLVELVQLSEELREALRDLDYESNKKQLGLLLSLNDSMLNKLSYYINPREI